MGLFDFLSGSDEAEQAAAQNRAQLAQYGGDLSNLYGGYQSGAIGQLGQGREAALAALNTGLGQQVSTLTDAYGNAAAAGRAGVAAFDPLRTAVQGYDPAVNAYYGALGLRGPQDRAQTTEYFKNQPGYQFQQDEAARQQLALASKTGLGQSGNTLQALGDRAQNIANTTYTDYLNRLGAFVPLQQQGYSALGTGVAGANRTLADIYNTGGVNLASAYGTNAAQQAALQSRENEVNVLGNVAAGRAQGLRDVTQGNIAANQMVAQAGQQDAANLWGLLGAGVKAAGSYFGAPGRA